jgi:pseudouridine synthase
MRLNKFLQAAGVASRRKADLLIKSGRVRVNGRVVTEPWHPVDPAHDRVEVEGSEAHLGSEKHYFKLYKPKGVTSTLTDPHAKRTLAEFVPKGLRLFPVGRLDRDSEGLILLTDDGDLAFRLTHPRFQVRKRYRVELDRPIFSGDLARLREGLVLEDGPFRPLEVRKLADRVVELSLHEGRKREIRRGFSALGYRVKRLVRLAIGPVELGALRPGELAPLSNTELRALGLEERAKPRSGNRPETD